MTLPKIELPWRRKTTKVGGIELPRIDLPRGLPKVDGARLAEASATITTVVDDARRAIAAGAEQAAERAGQLSQEAGKLGRELTASGESNLRSLGTDLREVGRDVRSLRITRQKKQRPNVMPGIGLLAGLGAGLAAMFFFDPEQGRRRRALLRDQLFKWSRMTSDTISGRAQDLRNRGVGVVHQTRSAISGRRGKAATDDAGIGSLESVVTTTPEAAPQLEATDAAAGRTAAGGVYSTGEYDASLTGDEGSATQMGEGQTLVAEDARSQTAEDENQPADSESIYAPLMDTVRDAWVGGDEQTEEGRRPETH
ncbi:MAG TPA: hypothetical protein VK992_00450 [Candidatus Caenarcaniphilales bacterium]|nr:hypothetical protein [Candidatus Caenarcaniphilales bacterium]